MDKMESLTRTLLNTELFPDSKEIDETISSLTSYHLRTSKRYIDIEFEGALYHTSMMIRTINVNGRFVHELRINIPCEIPSRVPSTGETEYFNELARAFFGASNYKFDITYSYEYQRMTFEFVQTRQDFPHAKLSICFTPGLMSDVTAWNEANSIW